MANIDRKKLIDMISEKTLGRYTKVEIYWMVKGLCESIEDIMRNGDTLNVANYFSIKPVLKNEHTVGNFGKGRVTIPAHYEPVFRPYAKLKNACADLPMEETKNEGK